MRVEGEQIRRLSQIRIEEMIDQAHASDALKYDDYVQELKAEYYYALNLKKHDDENDADASDTHTVAEVGKDVLATGTLHCYRLHWICVCSATAAV